MAKVQVQMCCSHCTQVTSLVPVLPTSHPLSMKPRGKRKRREWRMKGVGGRGVWIGKLSSLSLSSASHLSAFSLRVQGNSVLR
ncbi:hypothetical protein V8C37DRAFT_378418 [Trichoderma ceciliae]